MKNLRSSLSCSWKFILTGSLIVFFLMMVGQAMTSWAQETTQDVSSSVTVREIFTLSVDKNTIDFGVVGGGNRKELYESAYHTQAVCRSNTGNTWYLQVRLENSLARSNSQAVIASNNVEWMVDSTTGTGTYDSAWHPFQSSSDTVVYTSGPGDNQGNDVIVRLRYALNAPAPQPFGLYQTQLTYTLTETP